MAHTLQDSRAGCCRCSQCPDHIIITCEWGPAQVDLMDSQALCGAELFYSSVGGLGRKGRTRRSAIRWSPNERTCRAT